ncbi:IS110 family transposase [Persicirhabdus sediminis]|uniref:IS110 family transposase n=1 Tax=Persicirhabdus sediminis TaxID=454144 RepID=A0A8J7MCX0_9BACT|nr:IS110 family transposase [Persicirhabdus sediminis]MBK1790207.1 IS110 family transposase [Persicirhabdus sediminis]
MSSKKYYVGLDVHKESVAIASIKEGERGEANYFGSCGGSNLAVERALRKLAKQLGVDVKELDVCYEAGPTGFVLGRRLLQLGIECSLCAPSKTERKAGEQIKTDKRDAKQLARAHKNGDLTLVRIPPQLDEAMRDVCRARTDAVDDLARAKQRLGAFLLRHGFRYSGKTNWTAAHMRYLRDLTMPNDTQKVVLEEYLQAINYCVTRIQRFKDKLFELLQDWQWKPVVDALMACKGFQEVAATTIVSELGDLRRFQNPRQLMAFVGLVPSEKSSGETRRQGSITKCGNSHARWMLVECAQHFRRPPKVSGALGDRQKGQSKEVLELAWRMQNRLHKRYVKLKMRGKNENKCIVAVARELVAFIWELQNKCNLAMPEMECVTES